MSENKVAGLVLILTAVILASSVAVYSLYVENQDLKKDVSTLTYDVKIYSFESQYYRCALWDTIRETNYTFRYVPNPDPRRISLVDPYPRTYEGYGGWANSLMDGKTSYNASAVKEIEWYEVTDALISGGWTNP